MRVAAYNCQGHRKNYARKNCACNFFLTIIPVHIVQLQWKCIFEMQMEVLTNKPMVTSNNL